MPPDSTNPSPTQEVETWTLWRRVYGAENCGPWMLGEPGHPLAPAQRVEVVEVMPVEDHQRLLLAEEQKRGEVEEEREDFDLKLEGAESRLSAVEAELGAFEPELDYLICVKRHTAQLRRRCAENGELSPHSREQFLREANDYDARADRLQLLRDKGTEQGESR